MFEMPGYGHGRRLLLCKLYFRRDALAACAFDRDLRFQTQSLRQADEFRRAIDVRGARIEDQGAGSSQRP